MAGVFYAMAILKTYGFTSDKARLKDSYLNVFTKIHGFNFII